MAVAFHRSDRAAESGRRGLFGLVGEVTEHKHLALAFRERVEQAQQVEPVDGSIVARPGFTVGDDLEVASTDSSSGIPRSISISIRFTPIQRSAPTKG